METNYNEKKNKYIIPVSSNIPERSLDGKQFLLLFLHTSNKKVELQYVTLIDYIYRLTSSDAFRPARWCLKFIQNLNE